MVWGTAKLFFQSFLPYLSSTPFAMYMKFKVSFLR